MRIKENDIPKNTVKMIFGRHEFVVLPFILMNLLGVFMCLMNGVFWEYLDKFVQAFLDEIFIYSCSSKENEQHLWQVLQYLRENK